MSTRTDFDTLYTTIGEIVKQATKRPWWRKGGIQAQPNGVYATVFIAEGVGLQNEIVENVQLEQPGDNGEIFQQTPWGTLHLDCKVEFFRSNKDKGDTALQAAARFRSALRLEERFFDLWKIAALVGEIRIIDVSGIFRADVEPRAEVRFSFYANVTDPLPYTGVDIFEIDAQTVNVRHVGLDETKTDTVVNVGNSEEGGN